MGNYNMSILVIRGINLAVRDIIRGSSDPYVHLKTDSEVLQTYAQDQTLQPVWNQLLGPFTVSPNTPIKLKVYDDDTLSSDDPMGNAEIDVTHIVEASRMDLRNTQNSSTLMIVQPNQNNFLCYESRISFKDGIVLQDMVIRL